MDGTRLLATTRQKAIELVRRAFDSDLRVQLLGTELAARYGSFDVGWTTVHSTGTESYVLDLVLPPYFPYDPPLVWVRAGFRDLALVNSHVMASGNLCLFPQGISIAIDRPDAVAVHCLERARELLDNPDQAGFELEFASHWDRASDSSGLIFLIDDPDTLPDTCFATTFDTIAFVGGSLKSLQKWVSHYADSKTTIPDPGACLVARVGRPLTPREYPHTLQALLDLLKARDPSSAARLLEVIVHAQVAVTILLLQTGEHGGAIAGIRLRPLHLYRNKDLHKGFRLGHAPLPLVLARADSMLRSEPISRQRTRRLDRRWIHTRGGDGSDFSTNSVCLIGCGSLGGYVGQLLARSGVSRLTLVDPDLLDWGNVGRHALGATHVPSVKAEALAKQILRDLPHLSVRAIASDWRTWLRDFPDELANHDVIVSTTGDWRSEHALNMLARRRQMPPIIFAWLEPFAVAGHAMIVAPLGGCLACRMDPLGHFGESVSQFGDTLTLTKEPGSCEYYQPYGPIDLMPVASMTAEATIEAIKTTPLRSELRTWVGAKRLFDERGATLAPNWETMSVLSGFRQIYTRRWPRAVGCTLCG